METEELCSVNISPLVTSPFATQWSSDNQISIITEKGIHVLVSYAFASLQKKLIPFGATFILIVVEIAIHTISSFIAASLIFHAYI